MLAVILWTVGLLIAFVVVQFIYLSAVLTWGDKETMGLRYFGRPLAERRAFKKKLRRQGLLLFPILRLLGKLNKVPLASASFVVDGVAGPKGTCSPDSFAKAIAYAPRPEDVFVVTQMKCGTTWMQQLVYEILHRGGGDLVASGTALYAVSPWLEAQKSVAIDEATTVGAERPSRIVKTHLPVSLCPYDAAAKYIYVARHPLSCFASCADFLRTNMGTFVPPISVIAEWFCDAEGMWWSTWPTHVNGWWQRSQAEPNVLFVHFEDMKQDLAAVAQRVTVFLGMAPLQPAEMAQVVEKCGFAYMKEHHEAFEMHPPHLLATDAELFISGKSDRHKDVPADVSKAILSWCAVEMAGSAFPLADRYPDVVP